MKRKKLCVGWDTSNYTTSIAVVDETCTLVAEERRVLAVRQGERGLRQSQALFDHIQHLPVLWDTLRRTMEESGISFSASDIVTVAASERPRPVEDSYMPVFLAGQSQAKSIAKILSVPYFGFSHQEGHVESAMHGLEEVPSDPFLALHLSGGTTEVLRSQRNHSVGSSTHYVLERVGGTKDISYGQVVDRIGVLLGMTFPCGKEMDQRVMEWKHRGSPSSKRRYTPIPVREGTVHLSGIETQVSRDIQSVQKHPPSEDWVDEVLYALFTRLGESLITLIEQHRQSTGIRPVLLSGGVAASQFLRQMMRESDIGDEEIYFGLPAFSSDNAVGIARMGMKSYLKQGRCGN